MFAEGISLYDSQFRKKDFAPSTIVSTELVAPKFTSCFHCWSKILTATCLERSVQWKQLWHHGW